ncbi:erythromycin esterase family protein [Mucilaginibacter mali]|uniref:Erythromycin esterase family protein n=1 Tax=Mucilaginibacter mali TaxID=2740462 RepID=A0A7D4PW95_9SPHI|nr:erythromycin esterase family protein [Mucilaginibacter mali]QKJ31543.1 erythromycin esterase family protein [Mucilaginibacter mali]
MLKPIKWLFTAMLLCIITNLASAQTDLTEAIDKQLIPLTTTDPGDDLSDLAKLKPLLKDKTIIGIGEATHGTHEFFTMKHRMLQFLVKEMSIKTFVIEGDMAGTEYMNNYVLNSKGDLNAGIYGMGLGVWMRQEFVDMVNWVKAYNATQTPENKVRFYGCDMQYGTFAIKILKDELSRLGRFTPEMEAGAPGFNKYTPSLTGKEKAAMRNTVAKLAEVKFTDGDTALFNRCVRELQQVTGYIDAASTFFPAKQDEYRDKCMAENVEYLNNHTGQNKMMLWAHNAHIGKNDGSDGRKRMGMWLSPNFKDKYYAMGFDFNAGSMLSYDGKLHKNVAVEMPVAKTGSSGAVFAQCSVPNFILDFKTASADPVINTFLNASIPSSFYGASYSTGETPHYVTHKLAAAYDAMIFIRDTRPSMEIK